MRFACLNCACQQASCVELVQIGEDRRREHNFGNPVEQVVDEFAASPFAAVEFHIPAGDRSIVQCAGSAVEFGEELL